MVNDEFSWDGFVKVSSSMEYEMENSICLRRETFIGYSEGLGYSTGSS